MSLIFHRGVRLLRLKEPTIFRPIAVVNHISKAMIPFAEAEDTTRLASKQKGEPVAMGETLAADQKAPFSSIASVSGVFDGTIEGYHPLYGRIRYGVIANPAVSFPQIVPHEVGEPAPGNIIEMARTAGIIDEIDGVPLYEKLMQWKQSSCNFVVADAVEAQPYASSAYCLLRDCPEDVQIGLHLIARAVSASGFHIAVQLPYSLRRPLVERLGQGQVFQVRSKYPVERYTKAADDVAVGRVGAQACYALYRAVACGEKHHDAIVTVAGSAVSTPQNVRVPFGTPVKDLLQLCGLSQNPSHVILGDAMTGVTTQSLDVPILPGITCVLALSSRPVPKLHSCIGCGRCVKHCHKDLMPCEIIRRFENMHYESIGALNADQCDGCGVCSYVCPSGIDVAAMVTESGVSRGQIFLNWGDEDDT